VETKEFAKSGVPFVLLMVQSTGDAQDVKFAKIKL
jgi:hypothetical protein